MTCVSASILAGDLLDLDETLKCLENSGADMLHYDVMDGVFVDSITYGELILSAINSKSDIFLDVHLMTVNPLKLIGGFAEAGADSITFHLESSSDVMDVIKEIKSKGIRCGISIKPATDVQKVIPYLDYVDSVLVMTVEPGRGGQKFIPETLEKIAILKEYIDANRLKCVIQVDGGINDRTGKLAFEFGASNLVAGTYIFKSDNMKSRVDSLRF